MHIHTKAVHVGMTPAIGEYIEKRIQPLEKYLGGRAQSQPGHQGKEGQSHEATATIEVSKTTNHHQGSPDLYSAKGAIDAGETHIWASATDADLYVAIDLLRDELARELTSTKKKKLHLLRRGGQKVKAMLRGLWSQQG